MKFVVAPIYTLIVAAMLFYILREIRFLIRTRACRTFVSGTVTGLTEHRARYGSQFAPTVNYRFGADNYTVQIHHYYSYSQYRIGDEIPLRIDEQRPHLAILDRERGASLLQLAFSSIMLLLMLVLAIGTLQKLF